MRILNVVGARPNFMKIAPLLREMRRYPAIHQVLLHTGQHYDADMSRIFFDDLGLPRPDVDLEVGSGSHAWQTAQVMLASIQSWSDWPDLVLVVGDVNSTLACALVAAKRRIPLPMWKQGCSFDRSMPEINRMLTDILADYLFTTCQDATDNTAGWSAAERIFVGNVMVDTLLQQRARAERSTIRRSSAWRSKRTLW
jgi:UDP-N-acetylglucosamine 2-epimerase (non-hydrolysing)